MRHPIVLIGLFVALLVGLLSAPAGQVRAHANLIRSQPEQDALLDRGPAEVRLFFSEPLEPRFSEVIVYDRNRTPVAQAGRGGFETRPHVDPADPTVMFLPLPDLGDGTYTVAWKALSTVDGHITQGAFAFGVGVRELATDPVIAGGVATERPAVPTVVARWLSFLGLAGLVGGLIFAVAIVGPVARRQPAMTGALIAEGWLRRWTPVIWIAAAALVTGLVAGALARGALITGGGVGGAVGWILSPTSWTNRQGWLTVAGLALTLLLSAVAAGAARLADRGPRIADRGRSPDVDRLSTIVHGPSSTVHGPPSTVQVGGPAWWAALGVAAGLLLVLSLGSHQAVPSDFTPLAVAADWLHLLAACAWLGGLFHLIITWQPAARQLKTERERAAALAALIPRFSTIGLFSVALLVATGFFNGWLQIGTLSGLTETFYGRTLLIKLALFLPMVALGAANLLWIGPRIASFDAAGRKPERALTFGQRFRRFVALEAGFGVLVLLAAGILTNASPAFQAALAPKPIVAETRADGLKLTLTVTPGQVGQNVFDLAVVDANGRPVSNAERVRLQFEMTQMTMGQLVEEAQPRGDGHYVARGSHLSMGGPWRVQTVFRRPGEADTQATFNLEVRALPVNPVLQPPGPGAWPVGWAIGPALVMVGLLLAFNARRLVPVGRRLATGAALIGFLAFIGGAYFFATAVQAGTTGLPQNPIPASEASLARGMDLYRQSCASCHGPEGRGNGPAAAALNPRPVDLTVHATQHPPGQLFVWISQGIRGTAMPAFDATYSEEDRWHLVNYIRSLAEPRQ